ncbi:alpha/beta fold hydrolase [Elioraea sp.]|uniref:alpha/beta fold hydrolase n=1 Tax=Elioraea sp. TaxID=2185103 RepID=UPI003F725BA7
MRNRATARVGRRAVLAALVAGCAPRIAAPGPPDGPPRDEGEALVMPDGARLPLRSWLPEGPPRGAILALHGFNDYRRAFALAAPLFTAAGWAVHAYDQRGFGAGPHPGIWAGHDALAADATAAATLIRARHPGVPLALLGESMGAAVLLLAATSPDPPPADAYVLSAPAVWGGETMGAIGRWFLDLAAHTVPALGIVGGSPFIRASDNEAALRAMGRDPLVLKSTRVDAAHGLVALMDAALAAAARFDAPGLFLYGAKDDLVPERAIAAMQARLPGLATGRQRVVIYPDGYHLLLRDSIRGRVAADILAWFADPVAALPSDVARAEGRLPPRAASAIRAGKDP